MARARSRCSRPTASPTPSGVAEWTVSYLASRSRKVLHLFAALDTTMPTEHPELNEDEDDKESLELVNVLNLQW